MGNKQRDERAIFAYKEVKAVVDAKCNKKEYRSLAVRLPAMIQRQGLSMAMTYLQSIKKENHYRVIYETLVKWLDQKNIIIDKKDKVLEELFTLQAAEYRYAMEEVLQLSIWLKQLAEGMIESDD